MASSGESSSTGNDIGLEELKKNSPQESLQFNRSYNHWSPCEEGVTLVFRDLNIQVKSREKSKVIISGLTGAVKPGSLVALMGASGAGKSVLMSTLAYQNRNRQDISIEGGILINGKPIGPYIRDISAFMHQEDLFVASQTVWEHMCFMARLKLDRRVTQTERDAKCLELLRRVGLGHCLHVRIGDANDDKSLSGGEKKRLAFATELLTDPQILFCDEPTTGLDSYSAQMIVGMMNEMAAQGRTVLCTIHQPSSQLFAMFSQIMLLVEGRFAYIGSRAFATEFFSSLGYTCPSNYNPADFLLKTISSMPGAEESSRHAAKTICNHFSVSDYAKEVDVLVQYEFHMGSISEQESQGNSSGWRDGNVKNDFKPVFWWVKMYYLTKRYFNEILRNPAVQLLRMIQKMTIALMVGLCYVGTQPLTQNGVQALQGALVTVVCENTFPAMYSLLAEFPSNIPLFLREHKAGMYSPAIFYTSKMLAMLPGIIIEPILFVSILYSLVGLRANFESFATTAIAATLVMNVSCACGIFFSNAFNSVNNAMLCLVPFDYILMITSGFFINLSSLGSHIAWTKYFSWLMYGMESLTIVQWSGVNNITCENANPDVPCLHTGDEVLQKYSFQEGHLDRDLWTMIVMCVLFHVLAFFCLLRKIRTK